MPHARNDAVDVYYETLGPDDGRPVVFIHGFSIQLIGWRASFLDRFVERGYRVVLLDNRDVGLSTMTGGPDDVDGAYTLEEMAGDVAAVLDDARIDSAHIVGQSMGGMIAQQLAISHPQRVRSLNIIYSAPSVDERYRPADIEGDLSEQRPFLSREEAIAQFIERERIGASPRFAFDEAWITELAERSYDRSYRPDGIARQGAAVKRSGSRLDALRGLSVESSIIHGLDDAHLRPQAAIDMHDAIASSELHLYEGMGHEIVEPLWDEFVSIIDRTATRGEERA